MSCSVELRQRRQQGMAEDPHKLAAMMNKSQRLVLGLLILLLVDIIWVSSSELTKVSSSFLYMQFFPLLFSAIISHIHIYYLHLQITFFSFL